MKNVKKMKDGGTNKPVTKTKKVAKTHDPKKRQLGRMKGIVVADPDIFEEDFNS